MEEDFVTYEQAVALKKLGFDWKCDRLWHKEFTNSDKMALRQASADDFNHDDWDVPHCSAPTLAQAQKWLRDVEGIHVSLNPYYVCHRDEYGNIYEERYLWSFELMRVPSGDYWTIAHGGEFESYEEALSAGTTECLNLLNKE